MVSFLHVNDLIPYQDLDPGSISIKLMYYTFTTLSTVGFGDMVPLNNAEYVMFCFIMWLSVCLTSYVIGLFQNIITTFKSIDEDFD